MLVFVILCLLATAATSQTYYCATRYGSTTCQSGTLQTATAHLLNACDTVGGTDAIIAVGTSLTGYSCPSAAACQQCTRNNTVCASLCSATGFPRQGTFPVPVPVTQNACTPASASPNAAFVYSWPTTSTKDGGPCGVGVTTSAAQTILWTAVIMVGLCTHV